MSTEKKESWLSIIGVLIIALLVRTIVFEPYSIPTGSMKPNFLVGDYLFVSKYHYGISNASFPLSPNLFKGRIFKFEFNGWLIILIKVIFSHF